MGEQRFYRLLPVPASTRQLPTEIMVSASGEAVACYAGVPLLRFHSLDELLRRFEISEGDLEETHVRL